MRIKCAFCEWECSGFYVDKRGHRWRGGDALLFHVKMMHSIEWRRIQNWLGPPPRVPKTERNGEGQA